MPLKIAYLSLNSSFSHSLPVYGQLRSYSENRFTDEMEWKQIEISINENQDLAIQQLIEFQPELILSTAYLFNIESLLKIMTKISILLPETFIVLGGPEFLGNNEDFLRKYPFISAVFRGDETSLPDFLSYIDDRPKWEKIQGLCFIKKNSYIDNGIASADSATLDPLPSPYLKGYFAKNKPFIHFETSRGCPSKCLFCSSGGSKVSYYGLERVEKDLALIQESGIKEVRLLDRTFNHPEDRAFKLLEMFLQKFSKIRFHLEIDPSKLTERILNCFRNAPNDMFHLEAGVQSFSLSSLKIVRRFCNIEKVKSNLSELCSMPNLKVHTDLIAGLPNQELSDVIGDIKVLANLNPDEIQLEILKILPGSQLRDVDIYNLKYSTMPPYEVLQTSKFSYRDLSKIKIISRILDAYYNNDHLRKLFKFALKNDKDFLVNFSELYHVDFIRREKPSLQSRLEFFREYSLGKRDRELYDMTLFASLMAGIIPSKEKSVSPLKGKELELLERRIIWQVGKEPHTQYALMCQFDSDPASFYFNKTTQKPSSYIFYYPTLSFSKTISHIEEVIKN